MDEIPSDMHEVQRDPVTACYQILRESHEHGTSAARLCFTLMVGFVIGLIVAKLRITSPFYLTLCEGGCDVLTNSSDPS